MKKLVGGFIGMILMIYCFPILLVALINSIWFWKLDPLDLAAKGLFEFIDGALKGWFD